MWFAVHAEVHTRVHAAVHLRDATERLDVGEHGEHVFVLEESDGLEEVIVSHLVWKGGRIGDFGSG